MTARHVLIGSRWMVEPAPGLVIGVAHVPPPSPVFSEAERIQAALLAKPPAPLWSRFLVYLTQPIR